MCLVGHRTADVAADVALLRLCADWRDAQSRPQGSKQPPNRSARSRKQTKPPEPKPEDNLAVDPLELELGVRTDPPGRSVVRRRPARPRDARPAQDRPGARHHPAEGPHSRQHSPEPAAVSDQDSRRPRGLGRSIHRRTVWPSTPAATAGTFPASTTIEPAFGRPANWIEASHKERAELIGLQRRRAVGRHHHASDRSGARSQRTNCSRGSRCTSCSTTSSRQLAKVVEELIPDVLKTSQVHQVLGNLLRERVPIRDLETILETLGDYADRTKDLGFLTEYVRHALSRHDLPAIPRPQARTARGHARPALEDILAAGFDYAERGLMIKLVATGHRTSGRRACR